MAKISIYNASGKVVGDLELDPKIFEVQPENSVIHEAVTAQQSNLRQVLAHTKTKGEVRGGGKKPWKQKGTGRARQGSIRAPQWKGGGVVFGPRNERNFEKKINVKTKRKALRMTLTDKVLQQSFIVLDTLTLAKIKTKDALKLISALPIAKPSILVVMDKTNDVVTKSFRNMPKVRTILGNSLNVVDVLGHSYILTDKAGVDQIVATYKN